MRKLLWIGGGAVALIVVVFVAGVIFVFSSLDDIVKTTFTRVVGAATGGDVIAGAVSLSVPDGTGTIDGLTIANPAGYPARPALEFGTIALTIDSNAAPRDVLRLRDVTISEVRVFPEDRSGAGNLEAITRNIDAFASTFQEGAAGDSTADRAKLMIDRLTIERGEIFLRDATTGESRPAVALRPIVIVGLGAGGGAAPVEIADRLLDVLSDEVAAALAR